MTRARPALASRAGEAGLRVLAFARKELPAHHARLTHADVGGGLTFSASRG